MYRKAIHWEISVPVERTKDKKCKGERKGRRDRDKGRRPQRPTTKTIILFLITSLQ
jgi:hypothetical protein